MAYKEKRWAAFSLLLLLVAGTVSCSISQGAAGEGEIRLLYSGNINGYLKPCG